MIKEGSKDIILLLIALHQPDEHYSQKWLIDFCTLPSVCTCQEYIANDTCVFWHWRFVTICYYYFSYLMLICNSFFFWASSMMLLNIMSSQQQQAEEEETVSVKCALEEFLQPFCPLFWVSGSFLLKRRVKSQVKTICSQLFFHNIFNQRTLSSACFIKIRENNAAP